MDYTCTPEAWGWQPHDLLSLSAWNLKLYPESLAHAKLALSYASHDERLKNNVKLIENFVATTLGNE